MADIKKINFDGTEYNIKDEVIRNLIGDNNTLNTTDKSSIVNAINEVNGKSVEQVQVDYEQNDETASDYIKNRPFYKTDSTLLLDQTITIEDDSLLSADLSTSLSLVEDNVYKVVCNDNTMYLKARAHTGADNTTKIFIGDFSVATANILRNNNSFDNFNDAYAFAKSFYPEYVNNSNIFIEGSSLYVTAAGSYHIQVFELNMVVNEDEYNILLSSDYNQNNNLKHGYINNRPFYQTQDSVVYDALCMNPTTGYTNVFENKTELNLVVGETYKVLFDGIEYDCKCDHFDSDEDASLGNRYMAMLSIEGMTEESLAAIGIIDTGEPFFVLSGAGWSSGDYSTSVITKEAGLHRIKIFKGEIHKLDKKFLPDLDPTDWDQNDPTKSDYLKNRPFGYIDTTIDIDGNIENKISFDLSGDGSGLMFKISDNIPEASQFNGSKLEYTMDGKNYSVGLAVADEDSTAIVLMNGMILVAKSTEINNGDTVVTVPSTGIYLHDAVAMGEATTFTGVLTYTDIKKIDTKFLPTIIPEPTESDNGKFLRVVDGAASWVSITNAEEASF